MSIELFFREFLNEEMEEKIKNYKLARLMGWVSFKTYTCMSDPEEAMMWYRYDSRGCIGYLDKRGASASRRRKKIR